MRWGVVIKIVLAVCAVVIIAGAAAYVATFVVPQYQHALLMQSFDEGQLRSLTNRMVRVETVLHLVR